MPVCLICLETSDTNNETLCEHCADKILPTPTRSPGHQMNGMCCVCSQPSDLDRDCLCPDCAVTMPRLRREQEWNDASVAFNAWHDANLPPPPAPPPPPPPPPGPARAPGPPGGAAPGGWGCRS
jgi:hypothetical protein